MWDVVGNPEDRFSHNEAHMVSTHIVESDKSRYPPSLVSYRCALGGKIPSYMHAVLVRSGKTE